ncbi:MAG: metalloregulator ArsR/SmtB family transcription factor [bacterium]
MVYAQLARIGKAVASPRRLEILDLLAQGRHTVERLAEMSGMSVANASHHLQALRRARLVEREKRGLYVHYRLAGGEVAAFFLRMRALAETQLSEIEEARRKFFEDKDAAEAVGPRDLLKRVREGEAVLIDVRPEEEYREAHIPHAVSMPLEALKKRLKELPRNLEIVAYCRGPYCVLAVDAVRMLRKRGYRAVRLELGVLEWKAKGLAVATASM